MDAEPKVLLVTGHRKYSPFRAAFELGCERAIRFSVVMVLVWTGVAALAAASWGAGCVAMMAAAGLLLGLTSRASDVIAAATSVLVFLTAAVLQIVGAAADADLVTPANAHLLKDLVPLAASLWLLARAL